jgi:hypothetical protein
MIDDFMSVDRSGSAVLEALLRSDLKVMSGFDNLGLKEVVAVTA